MRRCTTSEDFGMPAEAKEAAAFALLAWQTWHRLPGNVPAATGAKRGRDPWAGDVCLDVADRRLGARCRLLIERVDAHYWNSA